MQPRRAKPAKQATVNCSFWQQGRRQMPIQLRVDLSSQHDCVYRLWIGVCLFEMMLRSKLALAGILKCVRWSQKPEVF